MLKKIALIAILISSVSFIQSGLFDAVGDAIVGTGEVLGDAAVATGDAAAEAVTLGNYEPYRYRRYDRYYLPYEEDSFDIDGPDYDYDVID